MSVKLLPKTKGKPAAMKGLPKPKRYMATTDNNDFLGQTFEQENKRCTFFIEKLIERLTYFGEDDKTLHYAFTNNIDLPPPKLKRAAITGSQPVDVDESNRLTKELAALQKKLEEITALQEEKATLESKVEKKTKEMDQLLMDISETTKNSEKQRETLKSLQKENAELKTEMNGAQLTDNDPAIADLSDPTRPLSLGEKFSDLYDNEWTDAMEEMTDIISDETKVIKLLLEIVCDAYKFCLYRADRFMDKINRTLSGFSEELSSSETMPKVINQTNKDYRKRLAVHVVKYLQQDFAKEAKRDANIKVGTKTEAYMKRCVFVCWLMTVQDPKVCISMKPPEIFDEDLYKPYTKKGKRLDYVVWPVLHLHKGGPILGKGVAQGKP